MDSKRNTERLKKAMAYAGAEAKKSGHDVIDARHVLIGLLRERGNVAAHVLQNHGVTLDGARRACKAQAAGATRASRADVPAARALLAEAARLSRSMHDDHLGSQHVLLALANNARAGALLRSAGAPPPEVRADLLALMGIDVGESGGFATPA